MDLYEIIHAKSSPTPQKKLVKNTIWALTEILTLHERVISPSILLINIFHSNNPKAHCYRPHSRLEFSKPVGNFLNQFTVKPRTGCSQLRCRSWLFARFITFWFGALTFRLCLACARSATTEEDFICKRYWSLWKLDSRRNQQPSRLHRVTT